MPLKEFPNPYTALKLLESTSLRSFALQLWHFRSYFVCCFTTFFMLPSAAKLRS
jgi:hypothetical protein